MKIGLMPLDYFPEPFIRHLAMQSPGPWGDFVFKGVPCGRYSFQFFGLPSDLYIADIRVGGRTLFSERILTAGPEIIGRVEIILGPDRHHPIERDRA
jgi:hypothetical protein